MLLSAILGSNNTVSVEREREKKRDCFLKEEVAGRKFSVRSLES